MKPMDKGFLLHHSADCQGKSDSYRCGQTLGNCGNCDGYPSHKHIKNRLSPKDPRPRNHHAYDKADNGNDLSQLAKTLLQGRFLFLDLG